MLKRICNCYQSNYQLLVLNPLETLNVHISLPQRSTSLPEIKERLKVLGLIFDEFSREYKSLIK